MQNSREQSFYCRFFSHSFLCIIFLYLAACANPPPAIPDNGKVATGIVIGAATGAVVGSMTSGVPVPIATAIGGITGGAIGMALRDRDPLLSELDRDHVQIVRIGEEIMIILPSDDYFYPKSTHMNENFYPALDRVAQYIRLYETTNIKVAGYTDAIGDELRNLALSRQQAQNIAKYLWNRGLDSRMIYSIGYGCQFPIANNDTPSGRSQNRRVQITFRYIPPDVA